MPYVAPTVADLKTRYAEFTQVPDAQLQLALDDAANRVDLTWREADFQQAQLLYAAHVLTLQGLGTSREAKFAALSAAGISQIKISSLSLSMAKEGTYARNSTRAGELASTTYGVQFLELVRLNFPAVLVV